MRNIPDYAQALYEQLLGQKLAAPFTRSIGTCPHMLRKPSSHAESFGMQILVKNNYRLTRSNRNKGLQ